MGSAERIAVFAAPDTKLRIETSEEYEWAFGDDVDRMLLLASVGVRVVVIDLTFSRGLEIKNRLQTLDDRCPRLILITRPNWNEPDAHGVPFRSARFSDEPGNPVCLVYPVDTGSLEVFIQLILALLDKESEPDGNDMVARVQPKIDEAIKRAEEFEQSTHLKPGDEHKRARREIINT